MSLPIGYGAVCFVICLFVCLSISVGVHLAKTSVISFPLQEYVYMKMPSLFIVVCNQIRFDIDVLTHNDNKC